MKKHIPIFTLPLLFASAQAATSATVPVNAATLSTCTFDTANSTPTIDLGDYEAGLASTYTGSQGEVTIYTFCNKATPLTARKLAGSATALSRATAVTVTMTLDGGTDTLNALAWMIPGTTPVRMTSGPFKGADRFSTKVQAGWPTAAQFGASSGAYVGTVDFSVEF